MNQTKYKQVYIGFETKIGIVIFNQIAIVGQ